MTPGSALRFADSCLSLSVVAAEGTAWRWHVTGVRPATHPPSAIPTNGFCDTSTLVSDVAALIGALGGGEPACLVGQGWGAIISHAVLPATLGYCRAMLDPAKGDPSLAPLRLLMDRPMSVPTLARCGADDPRAELMTDRGGHPVSRAIGPAQPVALARNELSCRGLCSVARPRPPGWRCAGRGPRLPLAPRPPRIAAVCAAGSSRPTRSR